MIKICHLDAKKRGLDPDKSGTALKPALLTAHRALALKFPQTHSRFCRQEGPYIYLFSVQCHCTGAEGLVKILLQQVSVIFLWSSQRENKFYVKNKNKYYFLTDTFYFLFIQLEKVCSFLLGPNFFCQFI